LLVQDADGDTQIQVEESSDEDKIRFDTGGTERMIIDSTGVGIGTSSPARALEINSGSSPIIESVASGSNNSSLRLRGSLSTGHYWDIQHVHSDNDLSFGWSGSEKVRITDTGNVGIGTTSPAQMLTLSNGTFQINGSSSFSSNVEIGRVGGDNNMGFATGGSERMRIDSSGNIGIGTSSPGYQLDLRRNDTGTTPSLGIRQLGTGDASMAFQTTTSPYGFIIGVDASDGEKFKFSTGTSDVGTATKLTIDTSGNVGIGTNSPTEKLTVNGALAITGALADDRSATAAMDFSSDVTRFISYGASSTHGQFAFRTATTGASSTERVRINHQGNISFGSQKQDPSISQFFNGITGNYGSGLSMQNNGYAVLGLCNNFFINSSSQNQRVLAQPTQQLQLDHLGNFLFQTAASGTAGGTFSLSEKVRINNSGQVSIGTTSAYGNLTIGGDSNSARILPATDNVGYIGESTHRWQAIYAVNGSIQTSDEREKTEIKETTLGLNFIKDLKPVSYKWIDGEQQNKGKDEREHQGLIAQQVAETVEKHGVNKNDFGGLDIQKTEKYDEFYGMSYDQFVAPLIKAIQEQQTQIDALQSEINLLKGE